MTHTCDTATTHDECERWYTGSSVSLQWGWSEMGTLQSGCQNANFVSEGRIERSCTVRWPDGTTFTNPVWIGIDRTPPALTGIQPDRPPDYNGWFNHPVGLRFQGADSVSSIASCSATTFGGPEGHGVTVSGSCTDVAGHTTSGSFPINYDATPPLAPHVDALPGDHRVALTWSTSPDSQAEVSRFGGGGSPAVIYRGPGGSFTDRSLSNQRRYRYVVTLIDQAGNRAAGETSAVPTASNLLLPSEGARLNVRREELVPPLLAWKALRRARYYNVQLFRDRRKILSAWPNKPQLQLKRRWRYRGKRYRLVAGRYCWHVWPGFGARPERRYGKRLGRSCFRITR